MAGSARFALALLVALRKLVGPEPTGHVTEAAPTQAPAPAARVAVTH